MVNLITGGTGTLGQALAKQLGTSIIYSRNEVAQVEMKRKFPEHRYIIGDIRDYKALKEATKGVENVYHLAAIKHITICEQQPLEAIKTNVLGTMNVIRACEKNKVKKLVFMSTDKAENPSCFYGTTKLQGEILVRNSNLVTFIYRGGNIFGSSGSVVPIFIKQIKENNRITLTDGEMTRFFELADDVASSLIGNRFHQRKSIKMANLASCIKHKYGNQFTEIKEVGARPGEKLHEVLNGRSSEDCQMNEEEIYKMIEQWETSL